MTLYQFRGVSPRLPSDHSHWVAPSAQVIGDVRLGAKTIVLFGATIRGDNEPISIGAGSNVQENSVLHTDPGFPLEIGENVTIGHGAILHGCKIGNGSLIGMGATVLNGAEIGEGCLIGAGALVTEGKKIPDGSMVVGMPGKIVKELDAATQKMLLGNAAVYQSLIRDMQTQLVPLADDGTAL